MKSRIQIERERKKKDFMDEYERLIMQGEKTHTQIFEHLAYVHGYKGANAARATYYRWKNEMETVKS